MLISATPQSLSEQKSYYEDQGYLIFPELLSSIEVAELRAALADVLREADGITKSNAKFSVVKADQSDEYHVRRIFNPIAHHPAFRDLVLNPKIVDIVENLLGPNIQLRNTKLNLKPPSRGARFEWHQDWPFAQHTNFDLLAVMVNFDDSTVENGCLTIVPGSHRLGPVRHLFRGQGGTNSPIEDETLLGDPANWLNVELPAGSMELHHCNMLHSSGTNSSGRPRSAMIVQYRAADNREIGGDPGYVGSGWGMTVRGTDPGTVRMVGGTFQLKSISG